MRSLRSLFLTATAVATFAVAAFAQSGIDNQVYHKIRGLQYYNTFDYISWQVSGSTVTLTGKVASLGTKQEAVDSVKHIPGVTRVINNIEDLPPSSFDDQIRRAALVRFTESGPAQYFGWPNPDVHIIVENGHLTLEGYVAGKGDSDRLNILANTIPGVFRVTNDLKVGERPKA